MTGTNKEHVTRSQQATEAPFGSPREAVARPTVAAIM